MMMVAFGFVVVMAFLHYWSNYTEYQLENKRLDNNYELEQKKLDNSHQLEQMKLNTSYDIEVMKQESVIKVAHIQAGDFEEHNDRLINYRRH